MGKQAVRTLILWAVLLIAFGAIWFFLNPGDAQRHAPSSRSAIAFYAPVAFALLVLVAFVFLVRRARRQAALNSEGLALLARGRFSEALERFTQLGRSNAVGVYNSGTTRISLWQLDQALEEFDRVNTLLPKNAPLLAWVNVHRAYLLALLGRLDLSEAALAKVAGETESAEHLLTRAIIVLRRGRAEESLALLDRFEVKQLGGTFAAVAAAVRGLARQQLNQPVGEIDRVALYGETGPEKLRAAWPELAAFTG